CNYEGRIFHALDGHRSLAYQTAITIGKDAIAEAEPLIRLGDSSAEQTTRMEHSKWLYIFSGIIKT
ncbi:hypothetical protein N8563_01495, partial [bacterium]|nr:hypothetical protein [bacterium]